MRTNNRFFVTLKTVSGTNQTRFSVMDGITEITTRSECEHGQSMVNVEEIKTVFSLLEGTKVQAVRGTDLGLSVVAKVKGGMQVSNVKCATLYVELCDALNVPKADRVRMTASRVAKLASTIARI